MLSDTDITRLLVNQFSSKNCHFHGALALDKMPNCTQHTQSTCIFVVNTHRWSLPGEHWIAIVKVKDSNKVLFIDSLRLFLDREEFFKEYLNSRFGKYKYYVENLPWPIQMWTSKSCGHFCCYILSHLPDNNYNLGQLIANTFTDGDYAFNESLVLSWYNSLNPSVTHQGVYK